MVETVLLYFLVAFISYFIGTINFSRIVAMQARKKDITTVGSHNPGAMNMLRSFGFGLALLTFVLEVVKVGLTCLIFKLVYSHFGVWGGGEFVYYFAGFFLMLGNDFPCWTKFKGGKGVACFAGIFLFSSIWYVSISWFVICFFIFILIDIGSVISLTYTGGLTIATTVWIWLTCPETWLCIYVTVMVWALYALTLFQHRANFKRLFNGTENKAGFKAKIKKAFNHKKGEVIIDEEQIDRPAEKEIVIEDDEKK